MITKKQILNEVTSTSSDGKFYASLRLGPRKWDEKQLGPFKTPANIFKNAELAHDEKDGELSISGEKAIEKETQNISNKIEDEQLWPTTQMIDDEYEKIIIEDLRVWFGTKKKPKGSSQPKGPWVNICRKDENGKHPPCGRDKAETKGYPKCRAAGVASKMSDAEKRNACQQKRKAEKNKPKTGTGNKPTMVSHKKKVIKEGITDIVYHYTSLHGLKNILESNKFYARFTYFDKKELRLTRKRNFYFSTTRNKALNSFDFVNLPVRIKLDGRKLSQKYKGAAIDYFGSAYKPSTKSPEGKEPEFEDRIMLDEPYIENASKYILGVSVRFNEGQPVNFSNVKIISKIIKICKEKNIPLAIFKTFQDFMLDRNPKYSMDWLENKENENVYADDKYWGKHIYIIAFIAYKNKTPIKTLFPNLTESNIQTINNLINHMNGTKKEKESFIQDLLKYISSVGDMVNSMSKDVIFKMVKDMRKYGTRDIEKYVKIKFEQDESK